MFMRCITYLREGGRVQLGPWESAPGWRPEGAPDNPPPFEPYEGENLLSQDRTRATKWRAWERYYDKMSSHIPRAVTKPGKPDDKPYIDVEDEEEEKEEYELEETDAEDDADEDIDDEDEEDFNIDGVNKEDAIMRDEDDDMADEGGIPVDEDVEMEANGSELEEELDCPTKRMEPNEELISDEETDTGAIIG